MPTETHPYFFLALMAVVSAGFCLGLLGLARCWAWWFSPGKPGRTKNAPYECGLESRGDAWIRFNSRYYLYAIVFLVFDVETIFLLPFAVSFTHLSASGFAAMMFFLLLLVEGLIWAWRKGVLDWC